jgi:hypothetical protein
MELGLTKVPGAIRQIGNMSQLTLLIENTLEIEIFLRKSPSSKLVYPLIEV